MIVFLLVTKTTFIKIILSYGVVTYFLSYSLICILIKIYTLISVISNLKKKSTIYFYYYSTDLLNVK